MADDTTGTEQAVQTNQEEQEQQQQPRGIPIEEFNNMQEYEKFFASIAEIARTVTYISIPTWGSGKIPLSAARIATSNFITDNLVAQGYIIFSPATYVQKFIEEGIEPPIGWTNWASSFIRGFRGMVRLNLPGFETDININRELALAKASSTHITDIKWQTLEQQLPEPLRRILAERQVDASRIEADVKYLETNEVQHITYLATPYFHEDDEIMEGRKRAAIEITKFIVQRDVSVYCPIMYCTAIQDRWTADSRELTSPPGGWIDFNINVLRNCGKIIICAFPGYEDSFGMACEIAAAKIVDMEIMRYPWSECKKVLSEDLINLLERAE